MHADRAIAEVDTLREAVAAGGTDLLSQLRAIEDAVLDVAAPRDEGVQDHEVTSALVLLIELRHLHADAGAVPPVAELLRLLVSLTDVLRRVVRRAEHEQLDDPARAAAYVRGQLDKLPAADVAALVGVSERTWSSWGRGGAIRKGERVVLITQLLTYLRRSMTQRGLLLWFGNEQPALGGASPAQLLDGDLAEARVALVPIARGGRAQLATRAVSSHRAVVGLPARVAGLATAVPRSRCAAPHPGVGTLAPLRGVVRAVPLAEPGGSVGGAAPLPPHPLGGLRP